MHPPKRRRISRTSGRMVPLEVGPTLPSWLTWMLAAAQAAAASAKTGERAAGEGAVGKEAAEGGAAGEKAAAAARWVWERGCDGGGLDGDEVEAPLVAWSIARAHWTISS